MHSNVKSKPVGKCKGCPLNLKNRCAVFSNPHEQWAHTHGKCKGYMNETLHAHYLEEQMKDPPPKTHKQKRQEKAAALKTISHRDGILNPGGSRW